MSIKAKRPPIRPPFNLSKFDLIKSIDKKTIVALREEIFRINFNGLTDNLIIESISEVETIKHPNIIDGVKNRD